jgi:hypothetical protein
VRAKDARPRRPVARELRVDGRRDRAAGLDRATPANPTNDNTPSFAFSSTDTTATFECQIDGVVTFTACSGV